MIDFELYTKIKNYHEQEGLKPGASKLALKR